MKKRIISVFLIFLFLFATMLSAQAADLEPPEPSDPISPYIGVATASIALSRASNGDAQATGTIVLKNGYYANATVALYKEWNTTPTVSWSQSSTYIWISQSYSVSSGYTYYATLSASIYDSNNNYVDTVSLESYHVHF